METKANTAHDSKVLVSNVARQALLQQREGVQGICRTKVNSVAKTVAASGKASFSIPTLNTPHTKHRKRQKQGLPENQEGTRPKNNPCTVQCRQNGAELDTQQLWEKFFPVGTLDVGRSESDPNSFISRTCGRGMIRGLYWLVGGCSVLS